MMIFNASRIYRAQRPDSRREAECFTFDHQEKQSPHAYAFFRLRFLQLNSVGVGILF